MGHQPVPKIPDLPEGKNKSHFLNKDNPRGHTEQKGESHEADQK